MCCSFPALLRIKPPFSCPASPDSFVLFHHPRSPPPSFLRSLNTPKHLSQSDHVRAFPISLASVETVEWIEVRDRNVRSVRSLTARVAHHVERSLPKAMLSNFDRSTAIYYERRRMNCAPPVVGPSAKAFKKGPFKSGSVRYAGVKFPFENVSTGHNRSPMNENTWYLQQPCFLIFISTYVETGMFFVDFFFFLGYENTRSIRSVCNYRDPIDSFYSIARNFGLKCFSVYFSSSSLT